MSIFSFSTDDDQESRGAVRKSRISRALDEAKKDSEFVEIDNKNEVASSVAANIEKSSADDKIKPSVEETINDDIVISDVPDIDLEIDAPKAVNDVSQQLTEPLPQLEPAMPKNLDLKFATAEKINIAAAIEENIKSEMKPQVVLEEKPVVKPELKVEPKPEPKPEAKPEEEKKEFSVIMSLATTRPVEVAYDLSARYATDKTYNLPLTAGNDDLRRLVAENPGIRYLDISDNIYITDFSPLATLTELEELDVSGCSNLASISFLQNLKKLRVLNAGITGITDLTGFPALQHLEVLNLKMNAIKSIDPLVACGNLHDLVLWGCSSLVDVNVVQELRELRNLDLEFCSLIKDIKALKYLNNISFLNLNFVRVDDLSPIKDLTSLEIFSMDYGKNASAIISEENMAHLEGLTKMKFLGLRNRGIKTLHYFRNMKGMAEMELESNMIQELSPLADMAKLQVLSLANNPSLTDLSPLSGKEKLKKLIISGTKNLNMQMEDISVVKTLPGLETFEAEWNKKIRDISGLGHCPKLEELVLNGCLGVLDATALRSCTNLVRLYLENCVQIKDLSFLKYLRNLQEVVVSKTSINRSLLSDLTRLYSIAVFKDDGASPIHQTITGSIKFRKKISKIAVKNIKEDK